MKDRSRWMMAVMALPFCMMGVGLLASCDGIMYPTVSDVNTMADADRTYQEELHAGQIDTLTEQHAAMAPEVRAELDALRAQFAELVANSNATASGAVATGPEISALCGFGIESLLSMFGLGSLIPIYNMFFGKSRAQKELDDMKLAMATRAGEKDTGL